MGKSPWGREKGRNWIFKGNQREAKNFIGGRAGDHSLQEKDDYGETTEGEMIIGAKMEETEEIRGEPGETDNEIQ